MHQRKITLTRLPLIGSICTWLSQRWHQQSFAVTHHTVRCPSHDCNATVTVWATHRDQRRLRRAHLTACSLLSSELVAPKGTPVWVPDLPYYDLYLQDGSQYPRYAPRLMCHKDCLYALNHTEGTDRLHQQHCISGVIDGVELEREITHNTVAKTPPTQVPWSYIG
jgi:hypothetical protein